MSEEEKGITEKYVEALEKLFQVLRVFEHDYTYTNLLRKIVFCKPHSILLHDVEDFDKYEEEIHALVSTWLKQTKMVEKHDRKEREKLKQKQEEEDLKQEQEEEVAETVAAENTGVWPIPRPVRTKKRLTR